MQGSFKYLNLMSKRIGGFAMCLLGEKPDGIMHIDSTRRDVYV